MTKQFWFLYFEKVIAEKKISGDGHKYNGKSQQGLERNALERISVL